jgi:AAA family ATP:ADP antiporter
MLPKPLRAIWGDLSKEEIKKFGILACTLFLIIGAYWLLRVMKNSTFDLLVNYEWQPTAKMASVVSVALVVFIYSKLVDYFSVRTLFWILGLFYGLGFIFIGYFINRPELLTIRNPLIAPLFSFIPGYGFGWFTYLFLESFGSVFVALFWSFVASRTTAESAKRGYGMIMSVTQLGVILGPLTVTAFTKTLGLPVLWAIGGAIVCSVPLIITYYDRVVPHDVVATESHDQKKKTGMFEGLKLLFSRSYLAGLFVVVAVYEVISTIVEFQMNMLIKREYPAINDGGAMFAWMDSINGVCVGVLSFAFALFGASYFMRKLGLKFCLVSFPIMIAVTLAIVYGGYLSNASTKQLMWLCFVAVIAIKGLNYALNVPSKEVLYIPTSKDVKFKAKGWIDAFGNRTTKFLGATVTDRLGGSLSALFSYGTIASFAIIGLWIPVAIFMGNKFEKLQAEKKIVE